MENITENYHTRGCVLANLSSLTPNGQGGWRVGSSGAQCVIASSKADAGWPDLHITMGINANIDGTVLGVTFSNLLGLSFSKGEIAMDTENFKAGIRDDVQLAFIDFKFLTHPDDMEVMLDGKNIKMPECVKIQQKFNVPRQASGFKIVPSNVFQSMNASIADGPCAACSNFVFLSDDYWRCRAQQSTINCNYFS